MEGAANGGGVAAANGAGGDGGGEGGGGDGDGTGGGDGGRAMAPGRRRASPCPYKKQPTSAAPFPPTQR